MQHGREFKAQCICRTARMVATANEDMDTAASLCKQSKVGGQENAPISSKPCAAENRSRMVHYRRIIQRNSNDSSISGK